MFFFFESDQEKRVREDIEKNLEICMQNPKRYEGSKQVIEMHISSSNQKAIEQVVDYVKATIKDEDLQPIRKYQAILLLRDLMRTHNKALGKYVVKKALKRLTILAQHKNGTPEEADDQRGRDIFGRVKRDQETYSIKFLNTLLSALEQWGTTWPKAPDGPYKDFHRQYNELVMSKVKFPKERPKESLKQVSRSLSPVATGKSIEKPVSSKEAPPRISKRQSKPQVKPALKPGLQRQLQDFYDQMLESIQLFGSFLEESTLQGFPVLRQIATEMNKASDKGNQLVVDLEGQGQESLHRKKIEAIFDFTTDLNKDINKVAKKGELFDKFKKIFVRKVNETVKILQQKEKKVQISKKSSVAQKQSVSQIQKEESTPQVTQPQIDRPKIKNQNRYTSVSGNQILEQFEPNQSEAKDPKESSLNSDRFGSFGGPTSERHGATITLDSPGVEKKKKEQKNNSGNKNESPPIPKRKTKDNERQSIKQEQKQKEKQPQKSSNSFKLQQKLQPIKQDKKITRQVIQEKPEQSLNKSQDFFKQFNKQSSKNIPQDVPNPFKVNDSFGAFGAQNSVKKDGEDDFFAGIQKKNVPTNNLSKLQSRRRPTPTREASERDIFQMKGTSKISDGLSAFEIPQPAQNSKFSGNMQSKKSVEEPGSRKSVSFDNPFGTDADPTKSNLSLRKSLDFFNQFEKRSQKQQMPNNLMIPVQNPQQSERGQNPFATGNFGGLVGQQKSRKSSINPFETQSYHSTNSKKKPYVSTSNPFQEASFQKKSRGSKASGSNPFEKNADQPSNPFQKSSDPPSNPFEKSGFPSSQMKVQQPSESNIFESKNSQRSNPFEAETQQNNVTNPFESKVYPSNPFDSAVRRSDDGKSAIESIVDIFRPPTRNDIEEIDNKGGFKKDKGTSSAFTPNDSKRKQSVAGGQSFMFTPNVQKNSEVGLNFSQFQDIAGAENNQRRQSFNQQNQSGFSLSNFNNIGNDPFGVRSSQMNNTKDLFAGFENKPSLGSKKSETQNKPKVQEKQPESLNKSNDFFAEFNQNHSKSKQSIEKKSLPKNIIDGQKTVKSHSQKSFDFSDMSGMQKKAQKDSGQKFEVKFEDFGVWGNNNSAVDGFAKNNQSSADPWNQSSKIIKKDSKVEMIVDNQSQSSLKWGQFDRKQKEKGSDNKSQIQNQFDQFKSNMLGMQSRNGEKFLQAHGIVSQRSMASKISRQKEEPSLDLGIEDFIPLSQNKKGIHWDPLSQIPNLRPPSFVYMVDQQKIISKRAELNQRKKEYNEAIIVFKQAKEKNNQIKSKFIQKMTKVDEIIQEKIQYKHILKKIKESNDIKEKQISEVNKRIKAVEQLKEKILQKQKQLYDITKKQIKIEDKKMPIQRTIASKWEMFNKNLQNQRTHAFTATRMSYQGY